ncbi:MAG: prenyltransferase/squalene oxidase repeat-containing protein [Thermoplasmata archaeon]
MRVAPQIRKWLTGPRSDPSIRAKYWIEVEGRSRSDSRVQNALRSIGRTGWAASLLHQQWPDGHWGPPGTSGPELYRPKFVTTHWVAGVLADMGMDRADPRVRRAAKLILDRYAEDGGNAPLDYRPGRGGELCVTGMVARTLIRFGYLEHPAVQRTIGWIVRTQKSDGGWHDSPSRVGTLDAWEGLAALAEIPEDRRTEEVRRSVELGAEFFLRHRLMEEGKGRYAPWFRIHYPNHYYYDVLVGLRILTRLGYGEDRRLASALTWLRRKRLPDGAWALDATVPDRLARKYEPDYANEILYPMMLEPLRGPSQWATVEALSVLALTESNEN